MSSSTSRLVLLGFAQLIVAIDFNIVYVALPEIGRGLAFSEHSLQWVISAYAIGFGGLLLLAGRLADRYGPRRMFAMGLALFALGCAVGGSSWSPATLVLARAGQGVGAALLTPAMLVLIFINFPEGASRTRALGAWGAAGSGGLAIGALLGGVLTGYLGWRSVLYLLVPLAAAALIATPRVLPATGELANHTARIDVPGAALGTGSGALLLAGVVQGPATGWTSASCVALITFGLALGGLFVLRNRRGPAPLVPPGLFRRGGLAVVVLVIVGFQSAPLGTYYIFTTYLQGARGYSSLAGGLAFVPLTVVSMFASLRLVGPLIAKLGLVGTLAAALTVNAAGITAFALTITSGGPFAQLIPGVILWGLGGGVAFPVLFIAAGQGLAPEQEGVAAAVATSAQQVGGALGLAAIVAVSATHNSDLAALRAAAYTAAAASLLAALISITRLGRRDRQPNLDGAAS